MAVLRIGVWLALAWSLAALLAQWMQIRAYGKRRLHARPAGNARAGAVYAFTAGMAPWAKESVMLHLPSYSAGILFHLGTFTAGAWLLASQFPITLPTLLLRSAQGLTVLGTVAGVTLLLKRLTHPQLRAISHPDDFVSNILTTGFAGLAATASILPALTIPWLIWTISFLIYLPLGKIRHCLFFFTTRYHFGAFFGRRGTFPPTARHS